MSTSENDGKRDNEESMGQPAVLDEREKAVQKNKSYYFLKWGLVPEPAKKNTWNWAAFFLTMFWAAYRKMYKLFSLLGLITILWMLALYLIDIPYWVDSVFYLAIALFLGWNGNRLYYNHTSQVLERAKTLPEQQRDLYIQNRGGTHIGIMIGLSALIIVLNYVTATGASYLPTDTNIKNLVRFTDQGYTLESFTDDPKWEVVKKTERYYLLQFTGYDYRNNENVRILFDVYFDKNIYYWESVSINGQLLNTKDADDYESYIDKGAK